LKCLQIVIFTDHWSVYRRTTSCPALERSRSDWASQKYPSV